MGDRNVLERVLFEGKDPTDLSLALLQEITGNFSDERKIGKGGFADIYKVDVQGKNVAVKKIAVTKDTLDDKQFLNEVKRFTQIKHPNIVRYLGFCCNTRRVMKETARSEKGELAKVKERLLCLEYISNGSLDKHITDELRGFDWDTRYQIIRGICTGLDYLHNEKEIIHMDLKPANVLLDDQKVPKITDFGLDDQKVPKQSSHTTGERFGTRGYIAPEFTNCGTVSCKCDIYSLGLIIIELVSGRKDIPDNKSKKDNILRRWRHRWNNPPTPLQYGQVTKCIEIAGKCRNEVPEDRPPTICDIIRNLDAVESAELPSDWINPYLDDDMLGIEPLQLHFKQMSCKLELTNKTKHYFAFNIVARREQYSTVPGKGIVPPGLGCSVEIIKLQAQDERVNQDADEFVVQSKEVSEGFKDEDITERMFHQEDGKVFDEVMVVYEPEENAPTKKGINFHPPENFSDSRPTNTSFLQRASDRAMGVKTGAMGSLLHKLGELLREEFNLEMSVKEDVQHFSDQLKMIHGRLVEVSRMQHDNLNDMERHWFKDARELSYDMEDVVDGFLVHGECADGFRVHQMPSHLKKDGTQPQIADVIKGIKVQVEGVAKRGDRYGVSRVPANQPAAATTMDPPTFFQLGEGYQRKPVGIDDTRDKLIKSLTDGSEKQLKIISIYGFGGLGKTTLAEAVYDKIKSRFNYAAIVSVGRNPDEKKPLRDILYGFDKEKYKYINTETLDVKQLTAEFRELTKNKRYFVIIDDIWNTSEWDTIRYALRDSDRGCRILTTTRNRKVAQYTIKPAHTIKVAQTTGVICKLEPLSSDNSEKLLYRGLYGGKGKCPNDHPAELTKKILHKCGGVPLAIITIATLLVGKPRDDWSKVYTSIGFGNGKNKVVKNTRKILEFSYYDLPCHLRTCLLHLSIYPEDYKIDKEVLILKWIAEGLVHAEKGVGLFEVGVGYFNDLANRSMIQLAGELEDPTSACRIHDLVLDMICQLSKDDNFVIVLDRNEQHTPQNNARRISVQKGVLEQDSHLAKMPTTQVRSFYASSCHISVMPSFEALRVLDMEGCTGGPYNLEHIGKLRQLRYLGLRKMDISELPEEIGVLRFLQTLYMKSLPIQELPHSVGLLRQLKCLHADDCSRLTTPDWIGKLTSIEKLSLVNIEELTNFPEELHKLKQLRDLCFDFLGSENERWSRAVLESIGSNLKKIQRLCLTGDSDCVSGGIWEGFEPPRQLRELNIVFPCPALPTWINSANIPKLTHLYVSLETTNAQDVETLGRFPELLALNLTDYGEDCGVLDISGAGDAFPKLRYLESGRVLRFEQGAMSNLEYLGFSHLSVRYLHESGFDFDFSSLGNLPMLGKVRVEMVFDDARGEDIWKMKASLRSAVRIHPNRPILVLENYDGGILDSDQEVDNDYMLSIARLFDCYFGDRIYSDQEVDNDDDDDDDDDYYEEEEEEEEEEELAYAYAEVRPQKRRSEGEGCPRKRNISRRYFK